MLDDIRDRGNKKWTAIMLPEHVKELREWMEEDEFIERPELNEWDLQSIQEEIEVAYKRKCETIVRVWRSGEIILRQGTIEEINLHSEIILLEDPFGIERIPVEEIIGVQIID